LDLLAEAATPEEILADFPDLEAAHIRACLAFGSQIRPRQFSFAL